MPEYANCNLDSVFYANISTMVTNSDQKDSFSVFFFFFSSIDENLIGIFLKKNFIIIRKKIHPLRMINLLKLAMTRQSVWEKSQN